MEETVIVRRFVKAFVALMPLLLLTTAPAGATGNLAPSGPHYNLNLHGVANGQNFSVSTGSNTHNIFAPLNGKCQINLTIGSFNVINPNCVNGSAAFSLPNPCPAGATATACPNFAYSVWVRVLAGKGVGSLATCFVDTTLNETFCNTGALVVSLSKVTPPKFTNVSKQLLSVCVNSVTEPIFANPLFNYFWQYDNQGLRLVQLRFYPIPTASGIGSSGCTNILVP
jgi:hypothetical protein